MNVVYAIAYILLWPVFRILKPTKAIGRENIQKGGLYCANHTRMSDPLFIAYGLGWPNQMHVMAKDEVMHWPILGWLLKKCGIFGVKRGESDVTAVKTAMKYLKAEERLLIFPEGTRHQDGNLGEAKTGAAMLAVRTGVPIVPIYLPPEKKWFRPNTVIFGEPYFPKVAGRKGTSEEYRAIADELMVRIESLAPQASV